MAATPQSVSDIYLHDRRRQCLRDLKAQSPRLSAPSYCVDTVASTATQREREIVSRL